MKRLTVVIVALFLMGCAKKPPVLVIDDWWNVDYAKDFAKSICKQRGQDTNDCSINPVADIRGFEERLATFFASEDLCHGIILANYRGPDDTDSNVAANLISKKSSTLMLNYVPDKESLEWTMMRHTDEGINVTSGTGTPKEIIHRVCGIIKQIGGKVIN